MFDNFKPLERPSNNLFSNKMSNLYHNDILTQLKQDENGFKIVDHLDKGKNSIPAHVEHYFDKNGNFIGSGY